ncbi:MAG: hypothetical protein PHC50_01740 [Candidatus Cloacimonetes bacterium]|nr:hypothetical protein [Candidatus Cloacimonadota bacterium]
MAGIFVHYLLTEADSFQGSEAALSALKAQSTQTHKAIQHKKLILGAVPKISQPIDDIVYEDSELGICIVLDGFCRISDDYLNLIYKKLNPASQRDHLNGIAYLISKDTNDWAKMLEGSFNIAVYDSKRDRLWIANDLFGFYPLYSYRSDRAIVFASKQSSILATGLIKQPRFDYTSFAEHLLFNYTISNNSFIEGISSLPAAQEILIHAGKIDQRKYQSYLALMAEAALNKKESFHRLNSSLEKACNRIMAYTDTTVNMSLTGGWDSRLVLSYLIKNHKDRLKLYSFGAAQAPDITVPQHISSSESLDYTPYILDDHYLQSHFKTAAHDTVMLSEGSRNYKRTHYLYAIQKVAENSLDLITGIFGDEVIKVGRPQGGAVISKNIVRLLQNGFAIDIELKNEIKDVCTLIASFWSVDVEALYQGLITRIQNLGTQYCAMGESNWQHLLFRFDINLRKYFGAEAASYNDYVNCYSPFTDNHFFFDYLKSSYSAHRHPFSASNIFAKLNSTHLYAKLVQCQYPALLDYPSSRGYNMRQALSYFNYLGILLKKQKGKHFPDAFNTKKTDGMFKELLEPDIPNISIDDKYRESLYSLLYWTRLMPSY